MNAPMSPEEVAAFRRDLAEFGGDAARERLAQRRAAAAAEPVAEPVQPEQAEPQPAAEVQPEPVRHGASAEAWQQAIDGGWADHLLPVVANPAAELNAQSKLSSVGKLPSQYDNHGLVVGIPGWTRRPTTAQDITRWRDHPDYGFCVRTGGASDGTDEDHFGGACLALDVDIDDAPIAQRVIAKALDLLPPTTMRVRANSPRAVLLYRIAGRVPKRRFLVQGLEKAAVELLGDGQQVLLAGRHPSGAQYEVLSADGELALPALADIPLLTREQLDSAWRTLLDAFGVVGSEQRDGHSVLVKPRYKRDIADPFIDALYAAGAVIDDSADGKAFVACPNAGSHSSDNGPSQTAYFPRGLGGINGRAVHCMHAGCAGLPLLRMLAEQNNLLQELEAAERAEGRGAASVDEFPLVELTAEQEVESGRAAERNAKIPAVVRLESDDERKVRREREQQAAERGEHVPMPTQRKMSGSEMLAELAFIEEGSRVAFIDQPRNELPFSEFKLAFAASEGVSKNAAGKPAVRHLGDLWVKNPERKTVKTTTFAPGQRALCTSPEGRPALNRWRDYTEAPPAGWRELVQPFVDHAAYLVPVAAERERFLDWLAHIAQRPGELPSTHYLMVAKQTGIGRNWLAYALGRAFAGYTALGFDLAETLRTGFNGALSEKLLAVVDELHEGGPRQQSTRVAEKLKSMLVEATRNVNPKYGRQRVEFNAARFLMLSNHDAALPLASNDRRVIVIENPTERRSGDYYARLYRLLDAPGFGAALREWLKRRDIGKFNPGELAPMNTAKARAIQAGRTEVEQAVRHVAETWGSDCITAKRLQHEVQTALGTKASTHGPAVDAGMVSRRARLAGERAAVWIVRDHQRWLYAQESEVRAEVERGLAAEGGHDHDFA